MQSTGKDENGFTSIPQRIYRVVITVTTVGYGDIVPHTVLGKSIASFAMIIGYAIIAAPTGIGTVEMARAGEQKLKRSANASLSVDRGGQSTRSLSGNAHRDVSGYSAGGCQR